MTDLSLMSGEPDPELTAHPQPAFKLLRDAGPAVDMGDGGMVIVGGDAEVRHVLTHPEIFSSGIDAVAIGQVRPLIPLQIDPPHHRNFRKLLDPIFAPRQVALLEDRTRALVRDLIAAVVDDGACNFHDAVAEPLPTTVFLQLLGLPVERAREFIDLKDGIIRPPVTTNEERVEYTAQVGQQIYAVLQEAIDQRLAQRSDDFLSMFLDAEVDGHRLTPEDVLDIGYLFFLAGLDTVTASLDCMLSYLAQHPDQRRRLVDDPSLIPHAVEEMLRWETPVQGVIRITTEDTEIGGCPVGKGRVVSVVLGSANTDERAWPDVERGRLRPGGQPPHRLRRRRPPLPGVTPRPHGAAGGAGGVAPGRPRLPPARRDRAALLPRPAGHREPGAGLVSIPPGERRLLIDGKLVDASGGATFDNVNPATEEVLGPTADGTAADMEAAVDAARRAFDTTDWGRDHAFRQRCLHQLQAALESEREALRAELVAEVGCPVLVTYGPQLDAPHARGADLAGRHDRPVPVAPRPRHQGPLRHGRDPAGGVEGADRRGRA